MGNHNHTSWYDKTKRKVLVLSFDQEYSNSNSILFKFLNILSLASFFLKRKFKFLKLRDSATKNLNTQI